MIVDQRELKKNYLKVLRKLKRPGSALEDMKSFMRFCTNGVTFYLKKGHALSNQ